MEFTNSDIILMDGGFPMDLVEKADPLPLWIDDYNETNPEVVIQNHISYLRAGSKLLKTNTYQSTIEGFIEHKKLTKEQAEQKIIEGVNLCHKAIKLYQESDDCDSEKNKILVVGATGTYGAHLHDGSDYTGDFAERVTKKDLKDFHRQQVHVLVNSNIDALAFETIPCQMEGEAIAELLAEEYPGVKAWISFQCKDELHLAHGELFHEVAEKCWEITKGKLLAVGVNCVNPRNVISLAKSLNEKRNQMIPLVLYPNSGEKYVPKQGWQDKNKCPELDEDADQWFKLGCKFVGGCCRTTPKDIEKLREAISAWKMSGKKSD
ncbi:homocysteine S-methyltransferase 2-like [Ctenocephalides felis]|uniref:homocysteine S-methyltransferase 2-like n=1 Tax=Ctenocephalides felis TaxID=7515 RepID=UPI000E6E5799|nr:homocysteine S-methyltransferase 2-like [Ctenocephalides felis]